MENHIQSDECSVTATSRRGQKLKSRRGSVLSLGRERRLHAEMCNAKVGLGKRLECRRFHRCIQGLEGAPHQPEVDGADNRGVAFRHLAKRTRAHRNSLLGLRVFQSGLKAQTIEESHDLAESVGDADAPTFAELRPHERSSPHSARFLERPSHVWLAVRESVDEHLGEETELTQVAGTHGVDEAVGMTRPTSRPRSGLFLRNEAGFDKEAEMPANGVGVQPDPLGENMRIEWFARSLQFAEKSNSRPICERTMPSGALVERNRSWFRSSSIWHGTVPDVYLGSDVLGEMN
jgi:hypothetical protein